MIRVMVVDDEKNALEMMGILLSDIEGLNVVAKFTIPDDALNYMNMNSVDAVFLDIDMPNISGLELAEKLKAINNDLKIVFITAHRDFAVEAFELNSVDYILKPVLKKRLKESVNRIRENHKPKKESLFVKCFTGFEMYNAEGKSVKWRTSKEKELWAYFVVSQGKYLERDKIIDDIWENVTYEKGKTYLHTCLSYLRKDLKALNLSKNIIVKESNGYRLQTKAFECDYDRFKQITSIDEYANSSNVHKFEKAIRLYATGLFKNEGYNWALPLVFDTEKEYIRILKTVIFYYKQQNNMAKSQQYLEKILIVSPYSDKYCRELMQIYVSLEERSKAVNLYRDFCSRLKEDMDILPEAKTTELYQKIRG